MKYQPQPTTGMSPEQEHRINELSGELLMNFVLEHDCEFGWQAGWHNNRDGFIRAVAGGETAGEAVAEFLRREDALRTGQGFGAGSE